MKRAYSPPRRGVAIVWLLVVLGLLTALTASIARQHWHNRLSLAQHQKQLQAEWLARAGLELAVGRLLADPADYPGETAKPIPGAQVQVTVKSVPGAPPTFSIASEARYPTDDSWPVSRSVTGSFRREVAGDQVRMERVGPEPATHK